MKSAWEDLSCLLSFELYSGILSKQVWVSKMKWLLVNFDYHISLLKQDKYLHTNCLATLANMAAYFRRLHPYTCQRLVSLLCVLNKRRTRAVQQIKTSDFKDGTKYFNNNTIVLISYSDFIWVGASKEDLEQDLSILEEVLRMLLEILNAAFTHQLGCNQHLIYSVLHKREVLDVLRRQPAFQDIVTNLDTVETDIPSLKNLPFYFNSLHSCVYPGLKLFQQQNQSIEWPRSKWNPTVHSAGLCWLPKRSA